MKKKLLFSLLASAMCGLGFSQTFNGIPTGEGYYINKLIPNPSGDEQTREYIELRGPAGELVPSNLYLVTVEGDGDSGITGRVDETIYLGSQGLSFGSNGLLAIISNYTQNELDPLVEASLDNPNGFYPSEYEGLIAPGTTIMEVSVTGIDLGSNSSDEVTGFTPSNFGYDGNLIDGGGTYMLIQADADPDNIYLDQLINTGDPNGVVAAGLSNANGSVGQDGIIDETGQFLTDNWILYDSVSFTDEDDLNAADGGEFAYGQFVMTQNLDGDAAASAFIFTTTSANVYPWNPGSNGTDVNFFFRQGLKTGHTTNDWVAGNANSSVPNQGISTNTARVNRTHFNGQDFGTDILYGQINPAEPNEWLGTTSSWGASSNWSLGFIPVEGGDVLIEASANDPIITFGANTHNLTVDAAASLTINDGGLIVTGTSTGDITYNLSIVDDSWALVASPVAGEMYDDAWVAANNIASGTANVSNRGIATYSNGTPNVSTGPWTYFQSGGAAETFATGTGYSMKSTGATTYGFIGTYPEFLSGISITEGSNSNWNLVGNTSPAFLDVTDLIAANTANLAPAFQAVYVYDGSSYSALTSGYINPAEAYFVNAGTSATTLSLSEDMLSVNLFFAKEAPEASMSLSVAAGNVSKSTIINFEENTSLGLDPGKDLGMFTGASEDLNIYTELVTDNQGIAFGIQSLPVSAIEGLSVPVGLQGKSGQEIEISVSMQNLSVGKVYLQEIASGELFDITDASYKTTLVEDINGLKYNVVTVAKSLSTIDEDLNTVSVYKSAKNELTITGLNDVAEVSVFTLLGKEVINTKLESNGVSKLNLPALNTGVYIVSLKSNAGILNKKIILE